MKPGFDQAKRAYLLARKPKKTLASPNNKIVKTTTPKKNGFHTPRPGDRVSVREKKPTEHFVSFVYPEVNGHGSPKVRVKVEPPDSDPVLQQPPMTSNEIQALSRNVHNLPVFNITEIFNLIQTREPSHFTSDLDSINIKFGILQQSTLREVESIATKALIVKVKQEAELSRNEALKAFNKTTSSGHNGLEQLQLENGATVDVENLSDSD